MTTKQIPAKAKVITTPLTAKMITRLKEVGINATTEADAREKLIKLFEENDLSDISDADTLDDLIVMASAFGGVAEEEEEEAEAAGGAIEEEEEEEAETTVATVKKTKAAAKQKKSKDEQPEEEDQTADESADELVAEVKAKKLVIPKKEKKGVPAVKTKKSNRVHKLQGKHWAVLTEAEKDKAVKPFKKYFSDKDFVFNYILKGFTVRFVGQSSEQNIMKFNRVRLLENGKLQGSFASYRFKTPSDFETYLSETEGRKLLKGESSAYIHPFDQDELIEVLANTDFIKDSVALATKQDTKMKINREKLEAALTNTPKKSAAAKPTKLTAVPPKGVKVAMIPEDDEEEEEVVPMPKKPTPIKKVTPVKKATPVKKVTVTTKKVAPAKKSTPVKKKAAKKK